MADVHIFKSWARWSGTREDLRRVADAASESITKQTGVPADISVTVKYKDRLSETGGMEKLTRLHNDELREIEDIDLSVTPDREAWTKRHEHETTYKPLPDDRVSLHIQRLGNSHLWVYGDDRNQVRGLMQTLAKDVGRGGGSFWHPFAFALCAEALGVGVSFGVQAAFGRLRGTVGWVELVADVILTLLAVALGYFYLFPQLQVRPDGEPSRWSRARRVTIGAAVTLALGVIAGFVVGAIPKNH